jgi:uncharacterized delta-60 repeat protein
MNCKQAIYPHTKTAKLGLISNKDNRQGWFRVIFWIMLIFLAACSSNVDPTGSDFELQPVQKTLELVTGGETSSFVLLKRAEGFTDVVNMTFEGLPQGIEQSWSRDTENGDCSLRLSVAEYVAPGTYTIYIKADTVTTSSLSAQQTASILEPVTLRVVKGSSGSLSAFAQPSVLAMPQNSETELTLGTPPFTGVDISFSNLPTGVSATLPLISPNLGRKAVKLKVASNAPQGSFTFNVNVSKDGETVSVPVQIQVQAATASPTFRLLLSSLNTKTRVGSFVRIRANIIRIKGFSEPITVSLENPPAGISGTPISLSATEFSKDIDILTQGLDPNKTPVTNVVTLKAAGGSITNSRDVNVIAIPLAGGLDKSFNTTGFVSIPSDVTSAIQADDKILIGSKITGGMVVRRYKVNGQLDPDFSGDGVAQVLFEGLSDTEEGDIRITPDGKILVHILFEDGARSSLAVAKLRANGQLDTSFNTTGKKVIVGLTESGRADSTLLVQTDGKILIGNGTLDEIAVYRLNANGTEDLGFGTGGNKQINSSVLESTANNMLALAPDGKIIVVGEKLGLDRDIALTRLLANGQVDTSFGSSGFSKVGLGSIEDNARGVIVDSQGRVLVCANDAEGLTDRSDTYILRFKTNGQLDTSFSGDGIVKVGFDDDDLAENIVIQADGKILFTVSEPARLLRLTTTGGLDSSFSGDGVVAPPIDVGNFAEVLLDSKGRIVVMGDKGLARYFP